MSGSTRFAAVPHDLNNYLPATFPPAAGHIERLNLRSGGLLHTSGWLVVPEHEITSLEVRVNGESLGPVERVERPDVEAALPKLPGARESGFVLVGSPLPPFLDGWHHVEVVAHAREGTAASIGTLYHPAAPAALPLPPPALSMRVVHTADAEFYRIGALRSFTAFLAAIRRHAQAPEQSLRLLDWGAGCGRLAAAYTRFGQFREVHGCDIDPETTGWAREHLGGEASFQVIDPYPPTPCERGSFDVVVAYSVMSHLDRESQRQWLREIRRILRPGGLFLASVHGTFAASATFEPASSASLVAEGIHDSIKDPALDGIAPAGYYRGTFQSRAYTEREWGKELEILEYQERGMNNWQDLVVMRAKSPAQAGWD